MGFMVDKLALGRDFSRVLRSSLGSAVPTIFHVAYLSPTLYNLSKWQHR